MNRKKRLILALVAVILLLVAGCNTADSGKKDPIETAKKYQSLISAGYAHTVGVMKDGMVVATGNNEYGQCDVSDWEIKK